MYCKQEWQAFGSIVFRPITLLFLSLSLAGLSSPVYIEEKNKAIIYLLQIIATVAAGVFGGLITDRYKEITGNTILWKKGVSAVRSLVLIRYKSRNIISRIKVGNNEKETINLVDLLEKDIANVSREWDDLIPGIVESININYDNLSAKELELEQTLQDIEIFESKLREAEKTGQKISDELKMREAEHRNKINELQKQISKLESKTFNIDLTTNTSKRDPGFIRVIDPNISESIYSSNIKCTKCQNEHVLFVDDNGLCPTCSLGNTETYPRKISNAPPPIKTVR
ncbi:MAG: hypothetical protein HXX11_15165 [Desulfuromonadales bacterium]|nr:hypothetical protein [Desulfuromonadales bacterium]